MDYHDYIPEDWWEEHDGQSIVLNPMKAAQLLRAAAQVVKQWQFARIDHQPMIDELVHLRELLRVDQS